MRFASFLPAFLAVAVGVALATAGTLGNQTRDIAIIGGGASGTYAAIRLQQMGYDVALVEKQAQLGGHVNTFHDTTTGKVFDYGVMQYQNVSVVTDFFTSLDVPFASLSGSKTSRLYANFQTDGKAVEVPDSVPWANQTALQLALQKYMKIVAQYPYLDNGFELPDPVPEDLLLPWGDFLDKYELGAISDMSFIYMQGLGNILAQRTLYVMKYFSLSLVKQFVGTGSGVVAVPATSGGNQVLYDTALGQLSKGAYLSSTISSIRRSGCGVAVSVSTPSGTEVIHARELLIAIQPTLSNLQNLGLDLGDQERSLFGQFNNSYTSVGVLNVSGLPLSTLFSNVDLDAPYAIPAQPTSYTFRTVAGNPSLATVYFGSPAFLSDKAMKEIILEELSRIVTGNGYNISGIPSFAAFENHSPYQLTVSNEAIEDRFYDEINALQGQRNTWWTGAAWTSQDSTAIWNWTEHTLLPKIVASL
ncbi:hypothetical protein N8I77_003186 [Diaporthe amygdali]|uniref:Uncharacterized protein n=1 Tax=Phomopsis amygdali TaxID=1214568 RepID=A0AAD9W4R1_PHOAM|nr:hypothetical protein N8I77_003186 [Diaporthe amygdali]